MDEQDPIADWLARPMSAAQRGTIKLDIDGQPEVKIDIINNENRIIVDLLQLALFKTPEDEAFINAVRWLGSKLTYSNR